MEGAAFMQHGVRAQGERKGPMFGGSFVLVPVVVHDLFKYKGQLSGCKSRRLQGANCKSNNDNRRPTNSETREMDLVNFRHACPALSVDPLPNATQQTPGHAHLHFIRDLQCA